LYCQIQRIICQAFLVNKADKTTRLVIDYRKLDGQNEDNPFVKKIINGSGINYEPLSKLKHI